MERDDRAEPTGQPEAGGTPGPQSGRDGQGERPNSGPGGAGDGAGARGAGSTGAGHRLLRQGYSRPRRDHPYDPRVLSDLAQVFMETTLREDGTVICPDRREALALAEQVLDILYYSGFYNAADVAGLRFHLYPRLEADGQPDLIYANTWMDGRWMEIAVVEVPRPNARPPEEDPGGAGGLPGVPGTGRWEPAPNGRVKPGLLGGERDR